MKGKKLLGLVAFTSCVMLAGCGEKPEIKIENMPTNFIIGQEIDFDNYVTYGNSKNFKVLPTEESASLVEINNHKLTVVSDDEAQDIKVRIVADDKEKDVTFNVISQVKMEILGLVNNVGYNYAVYDLYQKSQTSSELVADGGYYHNENYVYMDCFEALDQYGTQYIPGGFVKTSKGVFDFTLDSTMKTPSVEPMLEPLKNFNAYNLPFDMDVMSLEYQKADAQQGFNEECIVWYEDEKYSLSEFLSGTGLYQEYQPYDYYGYDYLTPICAMFYTKEADGKKQLYSDVIALAQQHQTVVYGAHYLYEFNEAGNHIEALDTFISQNKSPEDIDFTKLETFLSDVYDADNQNYSIETKFQWFDSKGKECDIPSFKDNSYYFESGDEPLFPNGTQTLAVTEKAVIKYQENDDDYSYASGLFEEGGEVYNYSRKSATEKSVVLNDKYDSMKDVNKEKANWLFDVSDFNYYPEFIFGVSDYSETDGEYYYLFNVLTYENLFRKMLDFVPQLVTPPTEDFTVGLLGMFDIYKEIDQEPDTGNIDYNLYNLLDQKAVILQDDNSSCEFRFDFMAALDCYYEISFKICKIGTTEIPANIASQLVVPNAD